MAQRRDVGKARVCTRGLQVGSAHVAAHLEHGLHVVHGKDRAHHAHIAYTLSSQLQNGGLGKGLQPLAAVKAALVRDGHSLAGNLQILGEPLCGLDALLTIRVTRLDIGNQRRMVAHHKMRAGCIAPARGNLRGKRLAVALQIVKVRHLYQLRMPIILLGQLACDVAGVLDAGAGANIDLLRIRRKDDHALAPCHTQLVQAVEHRRVAIAHGNGNVNLIVHTLLQQLFERFALLIAADGKRRALRRPKSLVIGHGALRAITADMVDDALADKCRRTDDGGVHQELTQVVAHRGNGWLVSRTGVHQQNACFHKRPLSQRNAHRHCRLSPNCRRRKCGGFRLKLKAL